MISKTKRFLFTCSTFDISQVGQWMVGIKRLIQEARNLEPSSPVEPVSTNPFQAGAVPPVSTAVKEQEINVLSDPETNQGLTETREFSDEKDESSHVPKENADNCAEENKMPNQSEPETTRATDMSEISSGTNNQTDQNDTNGDETEQTDSKLENPTMETTTETVTDESKNTS